MQEEEKERNILLEWQGPSRLYRKRGKEYYSTVLAIIFLLSIILVVLHEFLLIAVLIAFSFFMYALSSVEPEDIRYQITKKGVRSKDNFYRWKVVTDYWFEEKYGHFMFHLVLPNSSPRRLVLLTREEDIKNRIFDQLNKKLVFHEKGVKSWTERAGDWIAEKIQLESSESS